MKSVKDMTPDEKDIMRELTMHWAYKCGKLKEENDRLKELLQPKVEPIEVRVVEQPQKSLWSQVCYSLFLMSLFSRRN